jgi:exopolyphosphatase / guanosine-5'-triphosphate,3'-diphosphate pyrophosphatase
VAKSHRNTAMSFVVKTARTYDPDPAHSEQVTNLALALFDGLRELHGYGPAERRHLEVASRLHDIGWSRVVSGKHHKLSRDMILELDIPGMDDRDRLLCALIARYHTKALPDEFRHRRFASLDRAGRDRVEWLAGMLRVADGLDCTHAGAVEGVVCDVGEKAIAIHLKTLRDCKVEIQGARKKEDLLSQKTGKRIDYRCSLHSR